jgi:hypothetical protein
LAQGKRLYHIKWVFYRAEKKIACENVQRDI